MDNCSIIEETQYFTATNVDDGDHSWYIKFKWVHPTQYTTSETWYFTVDRSIKAYLSDATQDLLGLDTQEQGLTAFSILFLIIITLVSVFEMATVGVENSAVVGIFIFIIGLIGFTFIGWIPAWTLGIVLILTFSIILFTRRG